MPEKLRTYQKNNTKKPTTKVAQTPAQAMFEPSPFAPESQQAATKPPGLKTELMRAQRYGHNLAKIHHSETSYSTPVQAKKMTGQPLPPQQKTESLLQAKSAIGKLKDKPEDETKEQHTDRLRPPLKSHTNTINAVESMMDSSSEPQEQEESKKTKSAKQRWDLLASRSLSPEARTAITPERLEAIQQGEAVRRQVRVQTVAPGIIHTRIHKPTNASTNTVGEGKAPQDTPEGEPTKRARVQEPQEAPEGGPTKRARVQAPQQTPIMHIMENMTNGDTYDKLRVSGGASHGGVRGTRQGGIPRSPQTLATNQEFGQPLPPGVAVINGGFYAQNGINQQGHMPNRRGAPLLAGSVGKPIGLTSHRGDTLDTPKPWRGDYGAVTVNGQVGVSSGPALGNNPQPFRDRTRFDYNTRDRDGIPLSRRPGALSHANSANPRSAISMPHLANGDPDAQGDVTMHTLTTGGRRGNNAGVTMDAWRDITRARAGDPARTRTLNLDGGGSTFMGITNGGNNLPTTIARGEIPTRQIANIIYSDPARRIGEQMGIREQVNPPTNPNNQQNPQ